MQRLTGPGAVAAVLGGATILAGAAPDGRTVVDAGDLRLTLERSAEGVQVKSLLDVATGRELSAARPLPLFTLRLRHAPTGEKADLSADSGWAKTRISRGSAAGSWELRWEKPADERWAGLGVVARVDPNAEKHALVWGLTVENETTEWIVRRCVFPQVAVGELGAQGRVFFPRGPGEVQADLWKRPFRFHGTYPDGWRTMQFLAAYDEGGDTGLYVGRHDPWGGTKDIELESRPDDRAVVLAFDHPTEQMTTAGNDYRMSGEAVWRLLRGDWYDAAVIYRDWVRQKARWYPKLTADGRADTPAWMRELSVWALASGPPKSVVPAVTKFARFMGVPVGVHWYNWHQIPFDNDYQHYFPTKEGFAEGVRELKEAGVFVMPYINGRLWDTHDKGPEDFQFSSKALPAATKDEAGKPYVETYGSKESDDSPVRLAVMCPTTKLWRTQVSEIVLRLFDECGVSGVYIDQVAAAAPKLCFDAAHGHPLGGGHWWTEGYWELIDAIRRAKPADRMLTTECNGEPFIHGFDGYLTWHWQHDGQVPAFPAVYGGAIQMFGRAYRGGDTKKIALRAKAGQQLVFGEQIGWIDPGIIGEKPSGAFLRRVVQLRHRFRRYFYGGEMARPPALVGEIPTVRADWQWSGEWWVNTDAVLAGAWRLARENKLVLLFVNVSEAPVTVGLEFDADDYGLAGDKLRVTTVRPEGSGESFTVEKIFSKRITVAAGDAWAWELTPADGS